MAPLFFPADVAAIVTAFEPSIPTPKSPSLLRTNSGNGFIVSRKVEDQFSTLLQTSTSRIQISDLSKKLDVTSVDWLLDCHSEPLYYSREGKAILSSKEVSAALDHATSPLDNNVLELKALATGLDVDDRSLDQLLLTSAEKDKLQYWTDTSRNERYVYTEPYAAKVCRDLKALCGSATAEVVNVGNKFPLVPLPLLEVLLRRVLGDASGPDGTVITDGTKLSFEPQAYRDSIEQQEQASRAVRLQALATELQSQGFCHVPKDLRLSDQSISDELEALFGSEDGEVIQLRTNNADEIIVSTRSRLNSTLADLRMAIPDTLGSLWQTRKETLDSTQLRNALFDSLSTTSSDPAFASIVLESEHRHKLDSTIDAKVAQLERMDFEHLSGTIQVSLLIPLQLFASGLDVVLDTTLKPRVEEFLFFHARSEIVKPVLQTINAQQVRLSKSQRREISKFEAIVSEARSLSAIQASASKLAKKLKIDLPNDADLKVAQRQWLEERCRAMQKMKRGSDVLQNVVWVLLARHTDGVFLSSGKDTTRMIKLCQTLVDTDTARKLDTWREMVKSGKEDQSMLVEMKMVASSDVVTTPS